MNSLPKNVDSLQMVIEAMPVAVSWARLADQKILFMNRKFKELFGYEVVDFADIGEWVRRTYPFEGDRALVDRTWGNHLGRADVGEVAIEPIEIRVRSKGGEILTILNSGVLLPESGWALATFVDITERKRGEKKLLGAMRQVAENATIFRLLMDHSPDMIVLSPFDDSQRYVSPAVERITGFTQAEFLGSKGLDMVHPEDRGRAEGIVAALRAGHLDHVFRYRTRHKWEGYRWVEATVSGYLYPGMPHTGGYVATIHDVSAQLQEEERLTLHNRELLLVATLDELTGIPNRRAFNQAMERAKRQHVWSTGELSVLMLDVDHFKRYNDLYGHLPGDECLRAIAQAVKSALWRDGDFAARYGGEEFVVLMPMVGATGAAVVAEKILEAIGKLEMPHAGNPLGRVTLSIGIATWPASLVVDTELLLARADGALYEAKADGRNCYRVGEAAYLPEETVALLEAVGVNLDRRC